MTRRFTTIALACTTVLAGASAALADGGRTAWPGTAALAGAWEGTAASTAVPDLTFPVAATVSVAATGRPTGAVRLGDPVNCAGTWQPVSRSGRTTVFAETIVADSGDRCIRDGVVRLSPTDDGRLRYVWTKGDAGSVAYLNPAGLSGRWVGTITQRGLGAMTARIRVVGVRAGDMAGSSDYSAPLSCGGTLVPLRGTQRRAVFDEEITYSSNPRCVGSGTTTLTLRPDGRLAYRWAGGGEVSSGVLRRAR